ncbi:hypothetical protein F0562_015860 [Nyssa sinensis]|uniref:ENT domain-containing protein n=1 Tax=Nyssa sinensis TaxID=561372 RepID=A0A5J4ZLV8_9ASTE|nr:hypothetical protein F0562_015860 [Nyssa sinensis]
MKHSPSSSTLSSMKLKTLVHTLILSHVCRIARALSKAKSILIEILKEIQLIQFLQPLKKNKSKKINLFGSFRLHYNWCSSHVLPVSTPVLNGHVYYDSTWNSIISAECSDDHDMAESQLSGYLHWLEAEKVNGDSTTDQDHTNEIDKLADMFIANCHEKFRLEKQESYRLFQEMMARIDLEDDQGELVIVAGKEFQEHPKLASRFKGLLYPIKERWTNFVMDYDIADSSGTDDDLLPSHNNRVSRGGRVAVNGRSVVGSVPYPRMYSDMESQIHHLEQEAYGSVLRAFKAQSDALTWEKEGLITELRKELRVSDDEHRELLTRVNADDVIHRIREWRQAGGHHGSMASTPQPVHDLIPSPTVSASRKKQKTFQSIPLSFGMPSQSLHPQSIAASMQPSSPAVKWGPALGARGKNPKHGQPLPGLSSMKSMPYPSTGPNGRGQFINHGSSGTMVTNEPAEAAICDPLIGRKLMTRWPDDNNFYKAVIKDYDPAKVCSRFKVTG